jgi:hypothetical protein
MAEKIKRLFCKLFRHNYQPAFPVKSGLHLHECIRCGDQKELFVLMPGEKVAFHLTHVIRARPKD